MQKSMSDLYLILEIQNTNYKIQNTKYKVQNTKYNYGDDTRTIHHTYTN